MLRDTIKAETVTAMKAKDKDRTAALRLIAAKIKDRDIEMRTMESAGDDDAHEMPFRRRPWKGELPPRGNSNVWVRTQRAPDCRALPTGGAEQS